MPDVTDIGRGHLQAIDGGHASGSRCTDRVAAAAGFRVERLRPNRPHLRLVVSNPPSAGDDLAGRLATCWAVAFDPDEPAAGGSSPDRALERGPSAPITSLFPRRHR